MRKANRVKKKIHKMKTKTPRYHHLRMEQASGTNEKVSTYYIPSTT